PREVDPGGAGPDLDGATEPQRTVRAAVRLVLHEPGGQRRRSGRRIPRRDAHRARRDHERRQRQADEPRTPACAGSGPRHGHEVIRRRTSSPTPTRATAPASITQTGTGPTVLDAAAGAIE